MSFILATDFVDRNEGMEIKATRLSLFDNQPDNDSLSYRPFSLCEKQYSCTPATL